MCLKNEEFITYFKTFALGAAFFCLGSSVSCLGPTLPTLAFNLKLNVDDLAFVVPARSIGYMIGSLSSGFLYEKMESSLMFFVALSLAVIGNVLIPFVNYILLAIFVSTVGFQMGILDTAGNLFLLKLWKEKSPPYVQFTQFMFGVGACIAPLFAEPFIESTTILNKSNLSITKKSNFSSSNNTETSHFPMIAWPFFICAITTLLVSFCFLYTFMLSKSIRPPKKNCKAEENSKRNLKKRSLKLRATVMFLMSLFFFMYSGMFFGFSSFLYTFVTTPLYNPMNKEQGSFLNTMFWGTVTLGRLLAVFISIKFSPKSMMFMNLFLTTVSATVFTFYSSYAINYQQIVWVVVAVYGLGIASVFPTGISWAAEHISVNGRAISLFIVGCSLGGFFITYLIGNFIIQNPMNFVYINLVCILLKDLIFSLLNLIVRNYPENIETDLEDGSSLNTSGKLLETITDKNKNMI